MQCTASWTWKQAGRWLGNRLHILVLVSVILAALQGQLQDSGLGWVTCFASPLAYPPQSIELPAAWGRRTPAGLQVGQGMSLGAGWEQMRHTWIRVLARSELLAVLWLVSGYGLPEGVLWLPWIEWLMEGVSVAWPWLGRQPEVQLARWGLGWLAGAACCCSVGR